MPKVRDYPYDGAPAGTDAIAFVDVSTDTTKYTTFDDLPGGGGGATNLTWTAATSTVASDTGTDAVLTVADGSNPGLMSAAHYTKLNTIDADITTLSLPASTTISTFGASLVDDTTAATARATLGVVQEKVYTWPGDAVVDTGSIRIYFKRAATILNVYASASTAPTGASLIVDVNLNGTTIFTTQGNRPTIAISGFSDMTAAPDVTAVSAGDYITVDIDQIGSTIAGADIVVGVEYRDN